MHVFLHIESITKCTQQGGVLSYPDREAPQISLMYALAIKASLDVPPTLPYHMPGEAAKALLLSRWPAPELSWLPRQLSGLRPESTLVRTLRRPSQRWRCRRGAWPQQGGSGAPPALSLAPPSCLRCVGRAES